MAQEQGQTQPIEDDEMRFEEVRKRDEIDARMGFPRYTEGPARLGWLVNMQEVRHPVCALTLDAD